MADVQYIYIFFFSSLSLFITALLAYVLFSYVCEWARLRVLFIIGIVCACDPLWCVYVYVCVCMLSCVHVFCSLSLWQVLCEQIVFSCFLTQSGTGSVWHVQGVNSKWLNQIQPSFSDSERIAEQLRLEGRDLRFDSSRGFIRLEKFAQIGGHSNRVEALVAKCRHLVFTHGFNG